MTAIKPGKILFISHDATRTGAPFLLLHFLRWFKGHADLPFCILLKRGGALEPEFEALAPTITLSREMSYGSGIVERLASIMGFNSFVEARAQARLKKFFAKESISLVYSNTATNGEVLAWLRDLGVPIISHIHELEHLMRHHISGLALHQLFANTDYFVAGSEIVRLNLVQNHGVAPERVETIYEFIPVTPDKGIHPGVQGRIRAQLEIPDSAPIVGAAGTIEWRKGYDLFIQLAQVTYKLEPELQAHFVWVGGVHTGSVIDEITHDIANLGLGDAIHFIGSQTNYLEYIASFDVFSLMSREDPFPLVVLEAAMLNKPILCFDKGGGAGEFVQDDSGYIVPYLDIGLMGERLVTLLKDPGLRQCLGERAAEKVKSYDVGAIAPQILQVIHRILAMPAPTVMADTNAGTLAKQDAGTLIS